MRIKTVVTALVSFAIAVLGGAIFLRAHADAPAGQYTISSDGLTVLDNRTGLRWERNITASSTKFTWIDAMTHCFFLNLSGLSGWRVPNFKELATLVDERHLAPAIDPTAFPGTPGINPGEGVFWSSTPFVKQTQRNDSLVVDFFDGNSNLVTTSTPAFVRCVR